MADRFFKFQQEAIQIYQNGLETSILELYNRLMFNVVKIDNRNIFNVNDLVALIEKDISEIINEVKKDFCLVCAKDGIKGRKPFILPCSCSICSPNCLLTYFSIIFKNNDKKKGTLLY